MHQFIHEVRNYVGELLDVDPMSLDVAEELIDQGLDSQRLTQVLRFFRNQGYDLDFTDLYHDTSLIAWSNLLDAEGATE